MTNGQDGQCLGGKFRLDR